MMNKLFLDTEFNSFQGELMSMALVPEDMSKPEFYCEIAIEGPIDPWVQDNVVPSLHLTAVDKKQFQKSLGQYLYSIGPCMVVADWPDDIRHLCESLITGPGESLWPLPNIKFELDFNIHYQSLVPHNALWDARAIRDDYLQRNNNGKETT